MKQATSLKTLTLLSVCATAATVLMQACGGGSAQAQSTAPDANVIEGAWESTVTITDCTTGAVKTTFIGESLFHRGGTLTADNSNPVPSRGLGTGVWTQTATNAYTAQFHFLRFNSDGSLAGSQKVVRTLTLSTDGNAVSGTIAAQQLDTHGNVLAPICGAEVGARVY